MDRIQSYMDRIQSYMDRVQSFTGSTKHVLTSDKTSYGLFRFLLTNSKTRCRHSMMPGHSTMTFPFALIPMVDFDC